MDWIYILYIIIIGLLDAAAMISAKLWFIHKNPWYLLGAFLGLGLATVFFSFTLKYHNLVVMNLIWIGLSTLSGALVGLLIFKESMGMLQIIGMIVVLLGVILLNIK
jgi:small multidrug resistance pump